MTKQLVRDLIVVPAQIRKGDFVVRLTEGLANPEGVTGSLVPTGGLVQASLDDPKVKGLLVIALLGGTRQRRVVP